MTVEPPSIDPRYGDLLEALCCVLAADGKVSKSERKVIFEILTKIKAPITEEQFEASLAGFVARVKSGGMSSVQEASIDRLKASSGDPADRRVYLQALLMVAKADGEVDQREEKLISRYRNALESVDPSAETNLCPSCQAELQKNTVLCIDCGYNLQTQLHVITKYGEAIDDGWSKSRFSGRRFSIIKDDTGTPLLVVEQRHFWFKPSNRQYDLTRYREISTSSQDIIEHVRDSNDNDRITHSRCVGEILGVHLRPHHGGKEREAVFTFTGRYETFFQRLIFRNRKSSYTVAHTNFNKLVDIIRAAHPLPLMPRY